MSGITPQGVSVAPRQEFDSCAEIVVGPATVTVTVEIPLLEPEDSQVCVEKKALRVQSRQTVPKREFLIPLPVEVMPGSAEFVVRNGVLDFVLRRSSH